MIHRERESRSGIREGGNRILLVVGNRIVLVVVAILRWFGTHTGQGS